MKVAVVTYTREAHKKAKNRKWLDGTLKYNQETHHAGLYNEEGQLICEEKIPEDILQGNDEIVLDSRTLFLIDSWSGQAPPTGRPPTTLEPENTTFRTSLPRSYSRPRPIALQQTPFQPQPPAPTSQHAGTKGPLRPLTESWSYQVNTSSSVRPKRSASQILGLLGISSAISGTEDPPRKKVPTRTHTAIAAPLAPQTQPTAHIKNDDYNKSEKFSSWKKGDEAIPDATKETRPWSTLAAAAPVCIQPQTTSWKQQPLHMPSHGSLAPKSAVGMNSAVRTTADAPRAPGNIFFPTAQQLQDALRRSVVVADRFPSIFEYHQTWERSISEEINLRLADGAKEFYAACATPAAQPALASGKAALIEKAMRRAMVPYYGDCCLFIWKNFVGGKSVGWAGRTGKKKGHRENGADDDDATPRSKSENVYLILKSGRVKSTEYHKGDVWVISNNAFLRSGFDPGQCGDSTRAPWTAAVRSLWHGPNQDGKFEVEFLSPRPQNLGKTQTVYALKGPEAYLEFSLLDLMRSGAMNSLPSPLLSALLAGRSGALAGPVPSASTNALPATNNTEQRGGGEGPCSRYAHLAEDIISRFSLNEEQGRVIQHVAAWNSTPTGEVGKLDRMSLPVCLVHGPFGTGKSSLLVALMYLISSFPLESPLGGARVLVASHTNVAVDRVLLGLLESGMTDFLRVGSLRRIDRRLLGNSLHASDSHATASAVAELKDMLRESAENNNPAERALLRAELAAAERGAERQRKKLLKTATVVGVTCCSSLLPVFDNLTFDIVVLDEASQMIEPLSLAPILRSKCACVVAVGDPLQLPPVVASPPIPTTGPGLARPLFVRLASLGTEPHLLRRQYRCHPMISRVPNEHFYGRKLLDGCTPEQRPSLLPGLPPVVFLDIRGTEQRAGRGVNNVQEAKAAVTVVQRALEAGVPAARCGVICFYRAQVALVKTQLLHLGRSGIGGTRAEPEAGGGGHGFGEDLGLTRNSFDDPLTRPGGEAHDPSNVQVATVDSFQGAEKDLIVLTTATTRPGAFAADACRLNVALTRARNNLVVVGLGSALESMSSVFAAIIKAAKMVPGGYSSNGELPVGLKPDDTI